MSNSDSIVHLIRGRTSCRRYREQPIAGELRTRLLAFLSGLRSGPFGAPVRLELIAAGADSDRTLRGLGTYGFIRGATGYIAGAVGPGERNLEDYGYALERAVLYATGLGLGTCWLGGTFTKSGFARAIALRRGETLPAVVATGYSSEGPWLVDDVTRAVAGSDRRMPWGSLFFDERFGVPLSAEAAGPYAAPLEMVRLGPSARNKQPWRIVREGTRWHFFLERVLLHRRATLGLAGIADMPRLDLGIALCHFELAARELGLAGSWRRDPPPADLGRGAAEYIATWTGSV